jgi:hypothetical protein
MEAAINNKVMIIRSIKVILTPFGARIYTKNENLFKQIVIYLKNEGFL